MAVELFLHVAHADDELTAGRIRIPESPHLCACKHIPRHQVGQQERGGRRERVRVRVTALARTQAIRVHTPAARPDMRRSAWRHSCLLGTGVLPLLSCEERLGASGERGRDGRARGGGRRGTKTHGDDALLVRDGVELRLQLDLQIRTCRHPRPVCACARKDSGRQPEMRRWWQQLAQASAARGLGKGSTRTQGRCYRGR